MARLDNLFEISRGKLGNLVFYEVGGTGRIRTRAGHFRDKKSPKQLAQRQKLQVSIAFLKPFSKLLRITYAAEAVGRSAMQAAVSFNMRDALAGEYPDIFMEKSKVQLSRGPLPLPLRATAATEAEGLLIEWENGDEAAGSRTTDTLVVMTFSSETGQADYRFTETCRRDGRYVWKPALPDGMIDVWIAFRNREQTEFSDSLWTGQ